MLRHPLALQKRVARPVLSNEAPTGNWSILGGRCGLCGLCWYRMGIELSAEILGRMQRTLRRRFSVAARADVLDIAFGRAKPGGERDGRDPWECLFLVRDGEGSSGRASRRATPIPDDVSVRVRVGRRFQTIRMATGRLSVDGLEPSAVAGEFAGQTFTIDAAVSWRISGQRRREWGLLTVGHPFPSVRQTPVWQRLVAVGGARPFHSTLSVRARLGGRFDGAILRVARGELIEAGLLGEDRKERVSLPRSLRQLTADLGNRGKLALPGRAARSFRIQAFLPAFDLPGVGRLHHVVVGWGSRPQLFVPGSSGGCWRVDDMPACLQVASVAPNYRLGFGQAVTSLVVWAESALRRRDPRVEPASVQLTLLRAD